MTFCTGRWRGNFTARVRRRASTRRFPARRILIRSFASISRRLGGRRGRIRQRIRECLRLFAICTRCCRNRASAVTRRGGFRSMFPADAAKRARARDSGTTKPAESVKASKGKAAKAAKTATKKAAKTEKPAKAEKVKATKTEKPAKPAKATKAAK